MELGLSHGLAPPTMTVPSPGAIATIRELSRNRSTRAMHQGEVIFRAGDPGDCLYGIVEGTVRLDWNEGAGSEILGPGSSFGIGALVDPQHLRFGTATALSEGTLLVMNKEEFLFAVQELPMFGLEMLHDLDGRLRDLKASTATGA